MEFSEFLKFPDLLGSSLNLLKSNGASQKFSELIGKFSWSLGKFPKLFGSSLNVSPKSKNGLLNSQIIFLGWDFSDFFYYFMNFPTVFESLFSFFGSIHFNSAVLGRLHTRRYINFFWYTYEKFVGYFLEVQGTFQKFREFSKSLVNLAELPRILRNFADVQGTF